MTAIVVSMFARAMMPGCTLFEFGGSSGDSADGLSNGIKGTSCNGSSEGLPLGNDPEIVFPSSSG